MIPHHRPECYASPCSPSCPVRARIEELERSCAAHKEMLIRARQHLDIDGERANFLLWQEINSFIDRANPGSELLERLSKAESALAAMTADRDRWKAEHAEVFEQYQDLGKEVAEAGKKRDADALEIRAERNRWFREAGEWERKFRVLTRTHAAEMDISRTRGEEITRLEREHERTKEAYTNTLAVLRKANEELDEFRKAELARVRDKEPEQCKGGNALVFGALYDSDNMGVLCPVCGEEGVWTWIGARGHYEIEPHPARRP